MFEDKNKNAFTTASKRLVLDFPRLNSRFYPSPTNLNSKYISNPKGVPVISPYDIEESSFDITSVEKPVMTRTSKVHFSTTEKKVDNHPQILLNKDILPIAGKKRSKTSTLLNHSLKSNLAYNNHSSTKFILPNSSIEKK